MIFAALFAIVALALLCSLLFTMTMNALPLYAGVSLGLLFHAMGAGIGASITAGLVVGIATLTVAQIALATTTSLPIRATIGLMFACPAAFVGYHLVHGILKIAALSSFWAVFLALMGALIAFRVAWNRMARFGEDLVVR